MNKKNKPKIYLDNSPEAQEARKLQEDLMQHQDYLKQQKYEQKTCKTKEAREGTKLENAATKSPENKEASSFQQTLDNINTPPKTPVKISKLKQFFNKFKK